MLNLNLNAVKGSNISGNVDSQNLGREAFRRISCVKSGGRQRHNDCVERQTFGDSFSFAGVDTYFEKSVCVDCTIDSSVLSTDASNEECKYCWHNRILTPKYLCALTVGTYSLYLNKHLWHFLQVSAGTRLPTTPRGI